MGLVRLVRIDHVSYFLGYYEGFEPILDEISMNLNLGLSEHTKY